MDVQVIDAREPQRVGDDDDQALERLCAAAAVARDDGDNPKKHTSKKSQQITNEAQSKKVIKLATCRSTRFRDRIGSEINQKSEVCDGFEWQQDQGKMFRLEKDLGLKLKKGTKRMGRSVFARRREPADKGRTERNNKDSWRFSKHRHQIKAFTWRLKRNPVKNNNFPAFQRYKRRSNKTYLGVFC